jgi:hypothetical protein
MVLIGSRERKQLIRWLRPASVAGAAFKPPQLKVQKRWCPVLDWSPETSLRQVVQELQLGGTGGSP